MGLVGTCWGLMCLGRVGLEKCWVSRHCPQELGGLQYPVVQVWYWAIWVWQSRKSFQKCVILCNLPNSEGIGTRWRYETDGRRGFLLPAISRMLCLSGMNLLILDMWSKLLARNSILLEWLV